MALDASGKRLPWFKMWTRDFMADPVVQRLDWEQRGRFCWALMCSWESESPGLAVYEDWARWMGYEDPDGLEFMRVRGLFKEHPTMRGYLIQSKLAKEYEMSRVERAAHSIAGKRGAAARWQANAGLMRGHMAAQCGANGISDVRCQMSEEDRTTPSLRSVETPERGKSRRRTEPYTPGFEVFAKAYPRHEAKKPAFAIWKRLGAEEEPLFSTIMASVERFKLSDRWKDRQFIPMPTTFLNQERWNDELAPTPGGEDRKPWEDE